MSRFKFPDWGADFDLGSLVDALGGGLATNGNDKSQQSYEGGFHRHRPYPPQGWRQWWGGNCGVPEIGQAAGGALAKNPIIFC